MSLREELAAKELALLELRSSSLLELSNLRDKLRQRELDLADSSAEVQRLKLACDEAEQAAQTEVSVRESAVAELSERVQAALHEITRLRDLSGASERHRLAADAEHEKEIAAREAAAARRSRELQVLMARVQALSEKAEAASNSEVKWRQRVSAAGATVAKLQSEREQTVASLEEAARRYQAQGAHLERSRAERARLERELDEARDDGARLSTALQQQRERTAGIEQRLGQLESATSRAVESAAALARQSADSNASTSTADNEMRLSAFEVGAVRSELRRCIERLKLWRGRVEAAEKRANLLEEELKEAKAEGRGDGSREARPPRACGDDPPPEEVAAVEETSNSAEAPPCVKCAQLRTMYEDSEGARSRAEPVEFALQFGRWERVDAERCARALKTELCAAREDCDELRAQLDVAVGEVARLDDANQALKDSDENSKLRIRNLSAGLADADAAREAAVATAVQTVEARWTSNATEYEASRKQLRALLPAIDALLELSRARLAGKSPDMQLLLSTDDDPEAEKLAAKALALDGGMVGALQARRRGIQGVRTQIADAYAERLGSNPECQVQ